LIDRLSETDVNIKCKQGLWHFLLLVKR